MKAGQRRGTAVHALQCRTLREPAFSFTLFVPAPLLHCSYETHDSRPPPFCVDRLRMLCLLILSGLGQVVQTLADLEAEAGGTPVLLSSFSSSLFRLDALAKALSVIATATWLGGWVSVTVRYCIKTAKRIRKLFQPSESPIILVF